MKIQVAILGTRPDIDLIFSPGFIVSDRQPKENFYVTVKEWHRDTDAETFVAQNQIPILSALVKKEALVSVGLFNEDPGIQNSEDYHLWLKLLFNGNRFLSIPDFLFDYRVHHAQSTKQQKINALSLLNCYIDLVTTKVISIHSKALRSRLRWLIFQPVDLTYLFQQLRLVFIDKVKTLNRLTALSKIVGNHVLLKKIAFKLL